MLRRDKDSRLRTTYLSYWDKFPFLYKIVRRPLSAGELRITALAALENLGPAAKPAVPDFIKCLDDQNRIIRIHAFSVLDQLGPGAKEAVPTLCDSLQSSEMEDRVAAASVLGNVGLGDAGHAKAALTRVLNEESWPALRVQAAISLWKLNRETNTAVQVLSESLTDLLRKPFPMYEHQVPFAARRAVQGLGDIGSGAAAALPVLREAAKHDEDFIRTNALEAIRKIKVGTGEGTLTP